MCELQTLEIMLKALNGEATQGQLEGVKEYILNNVNTFDWLEAADMALYWLGRNAGDIYTEFSMRSGEIGMF